jgi:hypothetical protein
VIVWVDAQLPPQLASWLAATFGVDAQAVVREVFGTLFRRACALLDEGRAIVEIGDRS